MSVSIKATTTRLSRQESKARNRTRLLTVGRECFLHHGFKGATAEQISSDAGFTRGALHSLFVDKEGLFLAVVRESHQRRRDMFEGLISNHAGEDLLVKLREALADLLVDPEFLLLMEFELEALRNDKLRRGYLEFTQETMRDALRILDGISRSPEIRFAMDDGDFVIVLTSFVRGLAARQALLGDAELSRSRARDIISAFFDSSLLQPVKPGPKRRTL